jgi:hypothetical protein
MPSWLKVQPLGSLKKYKSSEEVKPPNAEQNINNFHQFTNFPNVAEPIYIGTFGPF